MNTRELKVGESYAYQNNKWQQTSCAVLLSIGDWRYDGRSSVLPVYGPKEGAKSLHLVGVRYGSVSDYWLPVLAPSRHLRSTWVDHLAQRERWQEKARKVSENRKREADEVRSLCDVVYDLTGVSLVYGGQCARIDLAQLRRLVANLKEGLPRGLSR